MAARRAGSPPLEAFPLSQTSQRGRATSPPLELFPPSQSQRGRATSPPPPSRTLRVASDSREDGQVQRGSRDDVVQSTNDDATTCKLSAVSLGYYEDAFVRTFAGRGEHPPRSPIINRGYWARVTALKTLRDKFLAITSGGPRQIVVVGAGFDTTFWTLQASGIAVYKYVEIDFPEIVSKKAMTIRRSPSLLEPLGPTELVSLNEKGICAPVYTLISGDLRDTQGLEASLTAANVDLSIPTFFLSECVLIYMEPAAGSALLSWAARTIVSGVFVTYEQIHPEDGFGAVMMKTLLERGCPLLSIEAYPDEKAQENRYLECGWQRATAIDLNTIYYEKLDTKDRLRIERLEFMDELEEWKLISKHYCIVTAVVDKARPEPGTAAPLDAVAL